VAAGESYYRSETNGGCSIITLLPVLNDKQWADIEKVGSEIVEHLGTASSPRFLVDLTPLSYMGSAMVALIVRLYKAVNSRNGQMVVVNQHELVFEVLKLAGLTKLWTIVDSREKGFAALGVKPGATAVGGAPANDNLVLGAGVIGAIGSIIGLALQFASHPVVPRKVALVIEFAFAFLGFVSGTMMLVNQAGTRRNVGIALLGICLLVVLGGILAAPEPTAPASGLSAATPTVTKPEPAVPGTQEVAQKQTPQPNMAAAKPAATTGASTSNSSAASAQSTSNTNASSGRSRKDK